jgi:hypothetical protein
MTVAFNDDCESASAPKIDYAVRAAAGLVFGALIFNFVLCFVNRNIFGISPW